MDNLRPNANDLGNQQQKKEYCDQEQASTPLRSGGIRGGYTTSDTCTGAARELLVHRLQRLVSERYDNASRLNRAIDILQRHPEFEEFLELLRSGLV
jgi:hypothetical protein